LKAIVFTEFGGPEVLRLEDLPTPTPCANEILLKVHSVSVNRTLDLIMRAGRYPVKIRLPHGNFVGKFHCITRPQCDKLRVAAQEVTRRCCWYLTSIFIYTDKSGVLNTIDSEQEVPHG
jgi:hypothetical protein